MGKLQNNMFHKIKRTVVVVGAPVVGSGVEVTASVLV